MTGARSDPAVRTRRRGATTAAALVLVVLATLAGCSGGTSITPPKPSADGDVVHDARAQTTLTALARAWQRRDAAAAAALGTGAGRSALGSATRNARTLRLDHLSLRYVADAGPLSATDRARYGSQAWLGTADLSYRVAGFDRAPTTLETAVVLVPSGDRVRVAAIGGHGTRTPGWLWPGAVATRDAHVAVVCAEPGRRAWYTRLARTAVAQVGEVLPDWHGPLELDVPPDEATLDAALQAEHSTYADIAAVTTTVDGTRKPSAAVHVFVNPPVFDTLKTLGAQVVLTHESTHVATRATFAAATLPEWLLEGFADYVALDHAGVPVAVAARQFLGRMRRSGLPRRLPTAADLEPTAAGLGATYEEAWTANRSLALHFGEARLVRFYDAVSAGTPVATAFRSVLGTRRATFVRMWRADLQALLSG